MSVDTRHPLYGDKIDDWITMRDTHRGESRVKEQGTRYLPYTGGQLADGAKAGRGDGYEAWKAYRLRALFPSFMRDAVEAAIGVMWHKPPTIELPAELEPMRENATIRGETLEQLLRRINEAQLITGRYGLLLDFPARPSREILTPYIATYEAECIINWDVGRRDDALAQDQLNLVVLDESEFEREASEFEWEWQEKYRVLVLGKAMENEAEGTATYMQAVFREDPPEIADDAGMFTTSGFDFSEAALVVPRFRQQALQRIPFVFVNPKDVLAEPDDPPMLALAKLALAVYRGEADYRQNLFMTSQDTLVRRGATGNSETRVGAGAAIDVPVNGDAKFIGVTGKGLSEQREALQNDRADAVQQGARLLDQRGSQKESGEALHVRVAAQTATLNQIALTGAAALRSILRHAAEWMGADPDAVLVEPNQDFTDEPFTLDGLRVLMEAKAKGAPISDESIHKLLQDRGMTRLSFEEEMSRVKKEQAMEDEEKRRQMAEGLIPDPNKPAGNVPGGSKETQA